MTQCPKREIPAKTSVTDFETLKNLIYYKEIVEIQSFSKLLQKKIMEQHTRNPDNCDRLRRKRSPSGVGL